VSKASIQTWHARLGHVNKDYIKRTAAAAEGIEITTDEGQPQAADCIDSRQIQNQATTFPPIPKAKQRSMQPLDLVHTDIAYALPETIHGAKYFLVLVDDYSRYTWAFPLTSRDSDEVLPILQTWLEQGAEPAGPQAEGSKS